MQPVEYRTRFVREMQSEAGSTTDRSLGPHWSPTNHARLPDPPTGKDQGIISSRASPQGHRHDNNQLLGCSRN